MPTVTISADEEDYWRDMAALLDPDAYTYTRGTSQTWTVAAGETDYLVGCWYLQGPSSSSWFHRQADFRNALPLTEGTTLTTDASNAGSYFYVCRPALVIPGDARYTTDPRALFFDRMRRISEETHYRISAGDSVGGNNQVETDFPTDFTDGLLLHVSQHEISWAALLHSSGATALAILNELGDNNVSRFAETVIVPFKRTTFPKWKIRGAAGSVDPQWGVGEYLKLDGSW